MLKLSIPFLSAALLLIGQFTFAEDTITYASEISFAEGAEIRQAIKDECKLETKLPKFLDKQLKGSGQTSNNPAQGKYLDMEITAVRAVGGGLYSGPKWVEVKGTLMENGVAGPTFTAKRGTIKGLRACRTAARNLKAIAKDIASWLEAPSDEALLGDAAP